MSRVLTKGGQFIFTDPMQSAQSAQPDVLQPILDRIHLDSLGSIEYYQQLAKDLGLKEVGIMDLSKNLPAHYSRVLQELVAQHHTLIRVCAEEYLDNMKVGLQHWVDAGMAGHLTCRDDIIQPRCLHFQHSTKYSSIIPGSPARSI